MAINFAIPDISDAVIDRSTGLMNDAWYRFFEEFERQTHVNVSDLGGVSEVIGGIQTELTHVDGDISVIKEKLSVSGIFGFAWDRPINSFPNGGGVIRHVDAGIPWVVSSAPATGGHRGWIDGTAPTADTTFTIKVGAVTVGTFTFANGALEATYTIANDYSVGDDDTVTIVAPANLHGMTGTVYGTLLGERS
jgi:hypothetical protein